MRTVDHPPQDSSSAIEPSPWFVRRAVPASGRRLFCFHHAGGNAHAYLRWWKWLPPDVDLVGVQLPGRGSRRHEPFAVDAPSLVASLGPALADANADCRPFSFFGHSMGAWLAFEAARWLAAHHLPLPRRLIVAGRVAPHLHCRMAHIEDLPDAWMIEELRKFDGLPDALAEQADLLKLFLPVIRQDLRLHRLALHDSGPPLPCPIRAVYADGDPLCSGEAVHAWSHHTRAEFELQRYPGGHFFFHEAPEIIVPQMLADAWDAHK
ncbi:thioesterase [Burkholderia sp. Bp9002]|nr:thioesterase [Burkholderia sp. Bp9002]